MKKLFSVFLASLLLLQLSLFALVDSSKSAAAAQQYSLQVIDNVMQFVKNDKVVRSVSLQNSTINLGKSKQGGIRVSVKDSTGKSRSFTLGSQTALTGRLLLSCNPCSSIKACRHPHPFRWKRVQRSKASRGQRRLQGSCRARSAS